MTTDPETFESFYKGVRDRLLLQTWSFTGDLSAAHRGVRDAFVVAWQHWRKLSRMSDDTAREDWLRPLAWRYAQRRRAVPHLHHTDELPDGVRETLDALSQLGVVPRKVLLLTGLVQMPAGQLAREVGIPLPRIEAELHAAALRFAALRGAEFSDLLLEPMAAHVAAQHWQRLSIVMRAGAARRQTHTLAGAVAATVTLVGSGIVVSQHGAEYPRLASLSLHTPTHLAPSSPSPDLLLKTDRLLNASSLGLGSGWSTSLTSDSGSTTLPCAPRAAADKHPQASLVRTFTGTSDADTAGEAVEIAATPQEAAAAYTTALGWYAGCTLPRTQLLGAQKVGGLGDIATLLALREWNQPNRILVAGVVRSGTITATVTATLAQQLGPALAQARALLAQALTPLCTLPGAGHCVSTLTTTAVSVPAADTAPGMLAAVDLPPATGITQPWAATSPTAATVNPAASHCDETSFAGTTTPLTRSFVLTKDSPGVLFGISETVGTLSSASAATTFISGISAKLRSCATRELGSKATRLSNPVVPSYAAGSVITLWRILVGAGAGKSATTYQMALIRRGTTVAQLSFIPAGGHTLTNADFAALSVRAADRLGNL